MNNPQKTVVDELVAALIKRPESFSCNQHTLDDKQSGLRFWVANGRLSGGIHHPYQMPFGMMQSLRFHRAVRAWKAWEAARLLRGNSQ